MSRLRVTFRIVAGAAALLLLWCHGIEASLAAAALDASGVPISAAGSDLSANNPADSGDFGVACCTETTHGPALAMAVPSVTSPVSAGLAVIAAIPDAFASVPLARGVGRPNAPPSTPVQLSVQIRI